MNTQLISRMPIASGRIHLENSDALNSDIIEAIHKNFKPAVSQTKNIAHDFKGRTAQETAYKIWKFLREDITYKKDPEGKQLIRLPSRFLADGTGDCKSYSLFTASILANLRLPVCFRYVSYGITPIPTHVYVVTTDSSGNEIIIDGVYKYFDKQKKYTFKKDYCMKVYTLSGHDDITVEPLGGFFQNVGKAIKNVGQKVGQGVKTVGLAPGRGAFLGLLLLNVHGFATKLAKAIQKDSNKVRGVWEKLGGRYSELQNAVNKGKTKKQIFGIEGIGVIDPATATAIATAAPIIAAIVSLLKSMNLNDAQAEQVLNQAKNDYTAQTGQDAVQVVQEAVLKDQANKSSFGFDLSPKNILIGLGVAGGLYLLTKS